MKNEDLALLEALLFVAGRPLSLTAIASVLQRSEMETVRGLRQLQARYEENSERGICVEEVQEGWRFCTKPQYGRLLQERYAPPFTLSQAALETLAAIAFKGTATRVEIEALRGVGSERSLKTLLEHELIEEAGRAELPGRPLIYRVTPFFERRSGFTAEELAAFGEEAITRIVAEKDDAGRTPQVGIGPTDTVKPADNKEQT